MQGTTGSIPDRGTKIPDAARHGQKKKKEIPKALVLTATSQHNSPFSNEIFSLHANCERLLYIKKKKKNTMEINL